MLEVLNKVERQMPELLHSPGWKSIDVHFLTPKMDRLWLPQDDHIVLLHCMYPCNAIDLDVHSHHWPLAVRILLGSYEMTHGISENSEKPTKTTTRVYKQGDTYCMSTQKHWHSVSPLVKPSYSLAVRGKRWGEKVLDGYDDPGFRPVSDEKRERLINVARDYYLT